ncbi:MAG: SMI1/KNR4 family protein, partial [Bacteroidota bacterium]
EGILSGAQEEDVKKLEDLIGLSLPAEVIAFYKMHNGQEPDFYYLMDGEELLSLERMGDEWSIWKDLLDSGDFEQDGQAIESEPEEGIRNNWWNPAWIPLTYDGAGNHYCLDLDPTPQGKSGQIIRMWHDSSERELIADSFQEWMEAYVDGLEAGAFVYSEEYGAIISQEDATYDFSQDRMSYYKIIEGQKYDAQLIYSAQSLAEERGERRISQEDAQFLYLEMLDANKVTPIEKATIQYLMGSLNWTEEAQTWMQEALALFKDEGNVDEIRSYQIFVESALRKYWQSQYQAYKEEREDLTQFWEDFRVDRQQEGLPEEVQASLEYYLQAVEQADFGSVRLYAIP